MAAHFQFWRLPRVIEETGLSKSAVYEGMTDGTFPKSFPLSRRSVAWNSDEVNQWKRAKLEAAGKLTEAA